MVPKPFLLFCVVVILLLATDANAQARSITWQWGNAPCAEMLGCHTGCSACNLPTEHDPVFFGSGAAWVGVQTCPEPVVVGDNAVHTEGWAMGIAADRAVLLSGITLTSMDLDSIIVRHRRTEDGPTTLRISLKRFLDGETVVVYEGPTDASFSAVDLRELGCAEVAPGMALGGFQVMLQVYGGNGGGWLLDEVRVVGTPCQVDIATGVPVRPTNDPLPKGRMMDVLGRPAPRDAAPGLYLSTTRRVVVVE